MSIGTTIRNLRRERDLTQEELAEVLGVTAKAVSQWENDRTAPDLSQIPAICCYFDITADRLLGIETSARRELRNALFADAQALAQAGRHREAADAFSAALARFPDDYEIMCFLNYSVFVCLSQGLYPQEERAARREDCIRRNRRIVAGCTEDRLRYPAIASLAHTCAEDGDMTGAHAMISRLPDMADAKNFVLPSIYTGDEQIRCEQWLLFDVLHYIRRRMMRNFTTSAGTPLYSPDEMAQKMQKVLNLFALFYEDGDIGFFHNDVQDAHLHLAAYAAEHGHPDAALRHLSSAADAAAAFLDYCRGETYVHTSLLFRGLENSGGDVSFNDTANNASEVLRAMDAPVFDALRGHGDFLAVRERLLPLAGTHDGR